MLGDKHVKVHLIVCYQVNFFPPAAPPGIYQGRLSLQAHQEGSAAEDVFSCKTELLFRFGSFDFNLSVLTKTFSI